MKTAALGAPVLVFAVLYVLQKLEMWLVDDVAPTPQRKHRPDP